MVKSDEKKEGFFRRIVTTGNQLFEFAKNFVRSFTKKITPKAVKEKAKKTARRVKATKRQAKKIKTTLKQRAKRKYARATVRRKLTTKRKPTTKRRITKRKRAIRKPVSVYRRKQIKYVPPEKGYEEDVYSAIIYYVRPYTGDVTYYKIGEATTGVMPNRPALVSEVQRIENDLISNGYKVMGVRYSSAYYSEDDTIDMEENVEISDDFKDDYVNFIKQRKRIMYELPEDVEVEVSEDDLRNPENLDLYRRKLENDLDEVNRQAYKEKMHEDLVREYREAQKQKKLFKGKKPRW